jgi:hypothetical protein
MCSSLLSVAGWQISLRQIFLAQHMPLSHSTDACRGDRKKNLPKAKKRKAACMQLKLQSKDMTSFGKTNTWNPNLLLRTPYKARGLEVRR